MSLNISGSVLKHIGKLEATIDFNTMSDRSLAMLKTYAKTGIIRTSGVTGKIAKYIRQSNELQYVYCHSTSVMFLRNIKDQDVYDAVKAALVMCRIKCGHDMTVNVRDKGGRWHNENIEKLLDERPSILSIWATDLNQNFKLAKLSDKFEINTDECLVVDVKKFASVDY